MLLSLYDEVLRRTVPTETSQLLNLVGIALRQLFHVFVRQKETARLLCLGGWFSPCFWV